MKFRVENETHSYRFLLDVDDADLKHLEACAAVDNVPVYVLLKSILESEIGRLWRELQGTRETFDMMGLRELAFARAAFVGDRDQAVREGDNSKARFCRGRIALIDQVLAERSGKVPRG